MVQTIEGRNVYLNPAEIPAGTQVLALRVRVPTIFFACAEDDSELDYDHALYEIRHVWIQVTDEEMERVRGDQTAINELGKSLGPVASKALGGYVRGWTE